MAIAIPLLMMSAGAGTMAIAATTLVLAVTGVSKKINDAASNVFGEDLVKAANIIGSVYIAYTSIAGAGGAEAGAEAGADAAAPAAGDAATSVTEAAAPTTEVAATAGNGTAAADFAGNVPTGSAAATTTAAPAASTSLAPDVRAGVMGAGNSTATVQTTAEELAAQKATEQAAQKGVTNSAQVKSWWNSLDPESKAAVIQTSGSMLSGALSGYGEGKAASEQADIARVQMQNKSTTVARVAPMRVTTATPGALRVR